jgi:hypothetical protein
VENGTLAQAVLHAQRGMLHSPNGRTDHRRSGLTCCAVRSNGACTAACGRCGGRMTAQPVGGLVHKGRQQLRL